MDVADAEQGREPLVALLYDDLRLAAHRQLRKAGSPQTWQTTAIINETWLKLHASNDWESREHFIRTASTTMRHVLIDAARARLAERRGGGVRPLPIEAAANVPAGELDDDTLVELGEALTGLATFVAKDSDLVLELDGPGLVEAT